MESYRAIEAVAKVEQSNALKRGRFVTLFNTHTIKSLTHEEREKFFNYLRHRKLKNNFLMVLLISTIVLSIIVRPGFTGNVIFANESTASSASYLMIAAFAVLLIIFLIKKSNDKKLKERFAPHLKIANQVLS